MVIHNIYEDRIGSVLITTNGLTIPKEPLLHALKKYNTIVTISDYRSSIHERSKLEEIKNLLEEKEIIHTIRESLVWCDFGFPTHPCDINEEKCREHMLNCDPGWRGLNDGKFYFCNVAWSAEKAGLINLIEGDYINLDDKNKDKSMRKQEILEYTTGNLKNGYVSFCKYCGGCGSDNKVFVNAGQQIL